MMDGQFSKGQLQKAMPRAIRDRVTDEFVEKLNQLSIDPEMQEAFKENFLSYTSVMVDGRYKLQGYIDAVKYVSYKLMGSSNIEAYSKTFPDRVQRLIDDGADDKTISSYVSAYNKTQLVNKILEQTIIPTHVLNHHLYQKAINVQAELMVTARSEKVRADAAACLISQLKPPETKKIEIDMGNKADKTIDALRETTQALVEQQRRMLEAGATAQSIAKQKIIDGEYEEVTHVPD